MKEQIKLDYLAGIDAGIIFHLEGFGRMDYLKISPTSNSDDSVNSPFNLHIQTSPYHQGIEFTNFDEVVKRKILTEDELAQLPSIALVAKKYTPYQTPWGVKMRIFDNNQRTILFYDANSKEYGLRSARRKRNFSKIVAPNYDSLIDKFDDAELRSKLESVRGLFHTFSEVPNFGKSISHDGNQFLGFYSPNTTSERAKEITQRVVGGLTKRIKEKMNEVYVVPSSNK